MSAFSNRAVTATSHFRAGAPVAGSGVTLCVIAKEADGWEIVAGQNTFFGVPPA